MPSHQFRVRPRGVVLVALGPCTLLAPVVFLLGIVAMLCWPFVLAGLALVWLAAWPVEWLLVALGMRPARGLRAAIGRVLALVARPWNYFDVPVRAEGSAVATPAEGTGATSPREGEPPAATADPDITPIRRPPPPPAA